MKLYLDTSVFGGYYDEEFKADTVVFFDRILALRVPIFFSASVTKELASAPTRVGALFDRLGDLKHRIETTDEIVSLANLYIKEGALPPKSFADAMHIACTTVAGIELLASWNLKHMVNFLRIKQYNIINSREGYRDIDIRKPNEIFLPNEEKEI